MKLIIFDTETTGLPQTKNIDINTLHLWPYIVQFSYIIYCTETNTIEKIKDSVVKIPDTIIITKENSDIHGITNEICAEKGEDIQPIIHEFIEDYSNSELLIAHNINFDLNILKVEILRQKINNSTKHIYDQYLFDLSVKKKYCTMDKTIKLCNIKKLNKFGREFIKFPKLSELHEKLFQVVPKNLHNSLNDVIVCLRCYYMLEYKIDLLESNKEINELFKNLL